MRARETVGISASLSLMLLGFGLARGPLAAAASFRRGDANADGETNLADAVFTLNWLFVSGPVPECRDSADITDDGRVNLTDPIYLLNALFLGGAPVPAPGTEDCGADPTVDDALDCVSFPPCGAGRTVREAWLVLHQNGGTNSGSAGSVVGEDGSVFVAISIDGASAENPYDVATIRLDTDGSELWRRIYSGPAMRAPWPSEDVPHSIALDTQGNVYVVCSSDDDTSVTDIVLLKYDRNGVELWTARYDGPGAEETLDEDRPSAVAVDGAGNVFVTGQSLGAGTDPDCTTLKYDAGGMRLWVARNDAAYGGTALAVDPAGNVYVVSSTKSPRDYVTIKYDPEGSELWAARYNSPSNALDLGLAIAVDRDGNSYVTGAGPANSHFATIKYGPDGRERWVARYASPQAWNGVGASAIALDGGGNVYVAGRIFRGSPGSGRAYAVVKYSPGGKELWVRDYGWWMGRYNWSYGPKLVLGGDGSVYLVATDKESDRQIVGTVKYDLAGDVIWVAQSDVAGDQDLQPQSLTVSAKGDVHVNAHGFFGGTPFTVKYTQE